MSANSWSDNKVVYEGNVILKRQRFWVNRYIRVFTDRLEYAGSGGEKRIFLDSVVVGPTSCVQDNRNCEFSIYCDEGMQERIRFRFDSADAAENLRHAILFRGSTSNSLRSKSTSRSVAAGEEEVENVVVNGDVSNAWWVIVTVVASMVTMLFKSWIVGMSVSCVFLFSLWIINNLFVRNHIKARAANSQAVGPQSSASVLLSINMLDVETRLGESIRNKDNENAYKILRASAESILVVLGSIPSADYRPPLGLEVVTDADSDKEVTVSLEECEKIIKDSWRSLTANENIHIWSANLNYKNPWPICACHCYIKSTPISVYNSLADLEVYKQVDVFVDKFQVLNESQLPQLPIRNHVTARHVAYKSVWPVQPRDYIVAESRFYLKKCTENQSVGYLLLSQSIDSHPNDPHPDGYTRGSLLFSAFLVLPARDNPSCTEVWYCMHADMKGRLGAASRVTNFVTQQEMPKMFQRLSDISIQWNNEANLVKTGISADKPSQDSH